MKIAKYLRYLHTSQTEVFERLKDEVDKFMETNKDSSWHYVSRVKDIESFALKVETGRTIPAEVEDFFACTLAVENLGSMSKAEKMVRKRFKLQERRPKVDTLTSKPSDSFRFDDTRLYVRWKDSPISRPTGLDGLLFEVQIKTFLAHAWSVATHDLTYKTDEKSWAKERIAFQVKAMLEHAEISIAEAQKLAASDSLNKTDDVSRRVSRIIEMVNTLWPAVALPQDRKRLAENINNLIENVGISPERLQEIIIKETKLGKGTRVLNLSPYCTIVQSLVNQEPTKVIDYVTGPKRDFRVYMSCELEMPETWDLKRATNAVLDV